ALTTVTTSIGSHVLFLSNSCYPTSLRRFLFYKSSLAHPLLHSFPTRRSSDLPAVVREMQTLKSVTQRPATASRGRGGPRPRDARSEEHTSELQSPDHLVCRLLLEKKKNNNRYVPIATISVRMTATDKMVVPH